MKKTMRLFVVLCAVTLTLLAACANDDDNSGGASGEYAVGKVVTISNVQYLVVENTEEGNALTTANASLGYYPNTRADTYRDHVLALNGINVPYVIVFNTETAGKQLGSTSTYTDEYLVLRDGKRYYRMRYRWKNSQITDYADKTTDMLRQNYDPSTIYIDTQSASYGTDLSKKFLRQYSFSYNSDGKTITYNDDNWRETEDYKDYVYIGGNERNQYMFTDKIKDRAHKYALRSPTNNDNGDGNNFFEFQIDYENDGSTPKAYQLIATGDGTITGTATKSVYQNTLKIDALKYNSNDSPSVKFRVQAKKNEVSDNETTFNDLYESVDKYVKVSDAKTTVNGISVPKTITFTVPFENTNASLGKFTTVTFVPRAKDNYVIYVPEEGTGGIPYKFINDFKDGYGIFGEYSLTRP